MSANSQEQTFVGALDAPNRCTGWLRKPTIDLTNQTTVLHAPMREHSRKPDEFYEMVESLCVGRRLDFFSREPREGWAQMGNDPDKFEGAA